MQTEDLIRQLGRELAPVRRLAPPWRRAAVWLASGAVYVAAVVLWARVRRGRLGIEAEPWYVVQQAALAAAACAAAVSAFASVVPGSGTRARWALAASVLVMAASLAWATMSDVRELGTLGVGQETDWPCVVSITLGGIGLWMVAAAMLRRGAALDPRLTSLLAGVAALSLANIEACVSRPHAFAITVIVWHGVTSGVVLMALTSLGRRTLAWRRTAAIGP